jgi:hypothetical protein
MTDAENTFNFLMDRDGTVEAISTCFRYFKIMKAAAKDRRVKYGRNDHFRRRYVAVAVDYRLLLTKLTVKTV